MRNAYFVGAKGLIIHNRRVLVMQRSATESMPLAWEFPGGGLEAGETVRQCFIREVWEEAGLAITQPQIVEAATFTGSTGKPILLVYFRVEAPSDGVKLSPEHCAFRWAARAEAEGLLLPVIVETLSASGVWQGLDAYID